MKQYNVKGLPKPAPAAGTKPVSQMAIAFSIILIKGKHGLTINFNLPVRNPVCFYFRFKPVKILNDPIETCSLISSLLRPLRVFIQRV